MVKVKGDKSIILKADIRMIVMEFQNGSVLILPLTPLNYHRYCYIANGRILHSGKIHGKLHCVRPIVLRGSGVCPKQQGI